MSKCCPFRLLNYLLFIVVWHFQIVCKGPNVLIGYYKNAEKTKETIDKDGWLHTGDIGQWLPVGD